MSAIQWETDQDWRFFVANLTYGMGSIIGIIISIIHSKNAYKDLSSSKTETKAKTSYKLILSTTLASIYCYTWGMIIGCPGFIQFLNSFNASYCKWMVINVTWAYALSKMFMYLSWIIRLYAVYNNPIFKYNITALKITGIITVLCAFVFAISSSFTSDPYPYISDKHDYIRFCHPNTDAIVTALTGVYDIALSIGAMIAFIKPLRNIIECLLSSNTEIESQTVNEARKLMQIGIKCAILTTTASFTTILFLITLAILGSGPILPIDFVTNMVCMILMTKYYEDKHYKRICCGVVKCGDFCMRCCCGYSEETMEFGNILTLKISRSRINSGVEPNENANPPTENISTPVAGDDKTSPTVEILLIYYFRSIYI